MWRPIITIFFILMFVKGSSQEHLLRYESQLIVDNDAFTGSLTQDQYYSSGIYPAFRMLMDSSVKAKKIRTYQLNHRMYTPSWVGWDRIDEFDRPYAGVFSVSVANEYYFHTGKYLKIELEAGIMGPHAYVGNAQRTWHHWFGMPHPSGWQFQIHDSPMLNVNLKEIQPFWASSRFDILTESTASFGTIFNYVREDVVFRVGKLQPINQSAYVGSVVGTTGRHKPQQPARESYFFYSPGMEMVLYNATLEGNLIGSKSPYTVDATRFVWQQRAGVIWSWPTFDFGLIAYWRKKENAEATHHNFVGIRLTQRF